MKMPRHWPIRTLVWSGLTLAALVLTALAWISATVVEWAAAWVSAGGLKAAGEAAADMPLPDWVGWWLDPAAVQALQALLKDVLAMSGQALPMLGQGLGWLEWLVWGFWALVMALLLLAGLKAHLLIGASQRG